MLLQYFIQATFDQPYYNSSEDLVILSLVFGVFDGIPNGIR